MRFDVSEKAMAQAMQFNYPTSKAYSWTGSKTPIASFYVRACYSEYYTLILSTLAGDRSLVTLTGSGGIGKSVFYIYFVQRYRQENPSKTLILASFTGKRVLKECRVFGPDHDSYVLHSQVPDIDEALHVYNGCPDLHPLGSPMVVFGPCQSSYMLDMQFEPHHAALYLPGWSLEEVREANEVLGLGLKCAQLEHRFSWFGGSALYCLSTDPSFVEEGIKTLQNRATNRWEMFAALETSFTTSSDLDDLTLGREPTPGLPFEFRHTFCSPKVAEIVATRIFANDIDSRFHYCHFFKNRPRFHAALNWMFKRFAKEALSVGGTFCLTTPSTLKRKKAVNKVANSDLFIPAMGYTHLPDSVCVDGYYFDGERQVFYVFHATALEDIAPPKLPFVENPLVDIRLVFVIPEESTVTSTSDYVLQLKGFYARHKHPAN